MSKTWVSEMARAGFALGVALGLSACAMPSKQYGLAPISQSTDPYPNINKDPTQKSAETVMTPEQRAAAEEELLREAGKLPKR
jgi:hypothetical protein